jgi:hypothetical protein
MHDCKLKHWILVQEHGNLLESIAALIEASNAQRPSTTAQCPQPHSIPQQPTLASPTIQQLPAQQQAPTQSSPTVMQFTAPQQLPGQHGITQQSQVQQYPGLQFPVQQYPAQQQFAMQYPGQQFSMQFPVQMHPAQQQPAQQLSPEFPFQMQYPTHLFAPQVQLHPLQQMQGALTRMPMPTQRTATDVDSASEQLMYQFMLMQQQMNAMSAMSGFRRSRQ